MTKNSIQILIVLFLLSAIVSCDRPACKNTNTIFDKYSPDTKEYKDELVNQLTLVDKSKLTYWMDTYLEENNSKFIYAYVQGNGLCAKIILAVNSSDKGIEGILKNKGLGYSGAELEGLKFDIKQNDTLT